MNKSKLDPVLLSTCHPFPTLPLIIPYLLRIVLSLALNIMRLRPVRLEQWEITDLKEVAPMPVHYDSDTGTHQPTTLSPYYFQVTH